MPAADSLAASGRGIPAAASGTVNAIISRRSSRAMTILKKILLVDSEPRAAAAVRRAFEKTGHYLIKEEHDSRCALKAARRFQPNLILFDVLASAAEASSTAQQFEQEIALKDTPIVL